MRPATIAFYGELLTKMVQAFVRNAAGRSPSLSITESSYRMFTSCTSYSQRLKRLVLKYAALSFQCLNG